MWMYKYGGIYADLDMECLKPLNELIKRHSDANSILFCDFDAKGNCISANPALLISKPGSNFWLEMLEYAKTHLNEYVIECTGPNALASVVNAVGKNFQVKCLDQNSLFIRKHNKPMYTRIMGNEFDFEIYRHVFCTTEKPDKYYQDRKHKFVADWHGTPERYRWRNEYKQKGLRGAFTKLKRRARNLFKL
jgi:mannosyltransferase OCH1-like enzyme